MLGIWTELDKLQFFSKISFFLRNDNHNDHWSVIANESRDYQQIPFAKNTPDGRIGMKTVCKF